MAVKTIICHIISCNGCGTDLTHEWTPHFPHPDDAFEELKNADWTVLRDGRTFCPAKECWEKMPACACVDQDTCSEDCVPGCPCLKHEQIEPDGPCEDCGYICERDAGMRWHRYTSHGKTTVIRTSLALAALSTSEVS